MRDVQMRDFGITRLEWAEPRDVSRGPTAGPWSVGLTSGPAIGRSSLPTAPSSPSYVVLAELTERVRARSRSDLRGQVCAYTRRLTAAGITEFLAANAPQSCAHVVRLLVRERSRFTEEKVERLVAGGVNQYVDLGADLNSFAWRRPTCVVSHQATLD